MKLSNIWSWGIFILLSLQIGFSQDFINYHSRSNLSIEQIKYLRTIQEEAITTAVTVASINTEQLKDDLLNVSMPDGNSYLVQKIEREKLDVKRELFVGKTLTEEGEVHFIQNGDMVTGHININGVIHFIRPLTNGKHAVVGLNQEVLDPCTLNAKDRNTSNEEITPEFIERLVPSKYRNEGFVQENSRNETGDSHTRLLVAYTQAVDNLLADPLSTIHLAISLTNTGYTNSGINQRLELARAIKLNYTESGSIRTDRNLFRGVEDNVMDTVHVERRRWRADMCHLITASGSGIAYINSSFGTSFAVTNYTYINGYTFGHEVGHNHECRHDPTADWTNTTKRGYGNPEGYFRTVMAYPSACGTGGCPRVNEFSSPNNTYYYEPTETSYPTGTENLNNVDGHNEKVATLANHYNDYEDASYEGITIPDDEAVHAIARMTLQNNPDSDDDFIYESGAEGSFIAGNAVSLKPGFWAKSGSGFEGKIEEYGPALTAPESDALVADATSEADQAEDQIHSLGEERFMKVYPNPFQHQTTVDYQLEKDASIKLYVRNTLGQIVKVLHQGKQVSGQHRTQLQASELAAGVYYLILETPDERKVEKIVAAGGNRK